MARRWLLWNYYSRGTGERFSQVQIGVRISREMLVRFICRGLVETIQYDNDGNEVINAEEFKSLCVVDGFVRRNLERYGTSFAEYWRDDVRDGLDDEIEAIADAIVSKLHPKSATVPP